MSRKGIMLIKSLMINYKNYYHKNQYFSWYSTLKFVPSTSDTWEKKHKGKKIDDKQLSTCVADTVANWRHSFTKLIQLKCSKWC